MYRWDRMEKEEREGGKRSMTRSLEERHEEMPIIMIIIIIIIIII